MKPLFREGAICASKLTRHNHVTGMLLLLMAAVISLSFTSPARGQSDVVSYAVLPEYVSSLNTYFTANGFDGSPNWFNMPLVVGDVGGTGVFSMQDASVYGEVTDLSSYGPVAATSLTLGGDYLTSANGQLAALPGFTFFSDANFTIPYANQEILVMGIDSSSDLTKKGTIMVPPGYETTITAEFTQGGLDNVVASKTINYENGGSSTQPVPYSFTTSGDADDLETYSSTRPIPEPSTMALILVAFGTGAVKKLRRRTQ